MIVLQIITGWMLVSVAVSGFIGAFFALTNNNRDIVEALDATYPYFEKIS